MAEVAAEPPAEVRTAAQRAAAERAPDPEENLFLAFMDRSSRERREQTASFERALQATREDFNAAIAALRSDFRIFGVIMLAGILALAGINVAINSGAINLTHAPATEHAP